MAAAAVHIVDGGVARSDLSGRVSRFYGVPVHTVDSCSLARERNPRPLPRVENCGWGGRRRGGTRSMGACAVVPRRDVDIGKTRMLSCVGFLVSPRDRGSWSLLVRRLAGRPQAAARYTAAGVR
jgi:hypothetical protein